ncbi:MAG: TatD family hydrolase [Thermoproteota archaeon]|nr:TatD family hydrolase [Candidatus Brockarchaeota archaeon]MBO3768493.1 TatD family hydrolase [Candidatus Brockarchaeota archaeon]MBO3802130.1 TatD family hydrolase [Candidatus Brockarchaeota archaeon]
MKRIGLVDVHCHISDQSFEEDRDLVIKRATDVDVVAMISNSENLEDAKKVLRISEKYKGIVFAAVGVHPIDLLTYNESFDKIKDFIVSNSKEIVAIGEVGLDYFYGRKEREREVMKLFLKEFSKLSRELDLPIIVHSRSAGKYAIEILKEMEVKRAILHAFDGKVSFAAQAAKYGYFFSIPPSIVRSQQKKKLVKAVKLENILLESDAPVLSPDPKERNEPKNVIISAQEISKVKGVSFEEVVEKTTQNALKLFNFDWILDS